MKEFKPKSGLKPWKKSRAKWVRIMETGKTSEAKCGFCYETESHCGNCTLVRKYKSCGSITFEIGGKEYDLLDINNAAFNEDYSSIPKHIIQTFAQMFVQKLDELFGQERVDKEDKLREIGEKADDLFVSLQIEWLHTLTQNICGECVSDFVRNPEERLEIWKQFRDWACLNINGSLYVESKRIVRALEEVINE